MSEGATPTSTGGVSSGTSIGNLIVIAGLTAVLFAGGLTITSSFIPELGMDIDFKPFFIVYAIILFVPFGAPTAAAALGATLAEGLLDIAEGAEADDAFGWVGYFVAFFVAGWIFDNEPGNTTKLVVGSIVGGALQYMIEGLYLFVLGLGETLTLAGTGFSSSSPLTVYVVATLGNTVLHGIVGGAILLIPTVRYLDGRIERIFPHASGAASGRSAD